MTAGDCVVRGAVEWMARALQPQTPMGREPMSMGTPDARSGHTCCVVRGRLYLLGGWDRTTFLNDAWMLDRCVHPSTPVFARHLRSLE